MSVIAITQKHTQLNLTTVGTPIGPIGTIYHHGNGIYGTVNGLVNFASSDVALWTPSSITTSLWYDASDSATITQSLTKVSQWNDKSGNTKHMKQATGTLQPVYDSANKKLVFDGIDDFMMSGTTATDYNVTAPASGNYCRIVLAKVNAIDNAADGLFGINAASTEYDYRSGVLTEFRGNIQGASGISSISFTPNTNWIGSLNIFVVVMNFTGSIVYPRVNGTNSTTTPATYTTKITTYNNLVVYNRTSANPLGADVYEDITFEYTLTNLEKIEGYLAWKWDAINGNSVLVGKLAITHPYKYSAPAS